MKVASWLSLLGLSASLPLHAACGGGYSDGTQPSVTTHDPTRAAALAQRTPHRDLVRADAAALDPQRQPDAAPSAPAPAAKSQRMPEAAPNFGGRDPSSDANLRVAHSPGFDHYLSDGFGQALYMYAGDTPGRAGSACLGQCAQDWPAFYVATLQLAPELDPADVGDFHRDDGIWQTTYKGYPLYYREAEHATLEVTADGVDMRWFLAGDYLVFFATAHTFTPAGGTALRDSFLTDGFGRTLYVCLDDQPRTPLREAVSSCDTACSVEHPVFAAALATRTARVPSGIQASDLGQLVRPDGQRQLTYRGWPLYYYSGDAGPGSTQGHNDRAWRAIDPLTFGLEL